jgi:hypothetical protein
MITEKVYKRINILRKFKLILDRKTLEKIYFTFVRPLLEYADVIWDNMSISQRGPSIEPWRTLVLIIKP